MVALQLQDVCHPPNPLLLQAQPSLNTLFEQWAQDAYSADPSFTLADGSQNAWFDENE